MTLNGPLQRYLAIRNSTREKFEALLEKGDQGALTLFAAECLFAELNRLADGVERLVESIDDQQRSKL
jgi:hypothetical protein